MAGTARNIKGVRYRILLHILDWLRDSGASSMCERLLDAEMFDDLVRPILVAVGASSVDATPERCQFLIGLWFVDVVSPAADRRTGHGVRNRLTSFDFWLHCHKPLQRQPSARLTKLTTFVICEIL